MNVKVDGLLESLSFPVITLLGAGLLLVMLLPGFG